MMLGTGTVAFIAPLAVEAVISRVGWRSAWVAIALWTVSVTPLVWFFLREPAKEAAASIAGETSVPAPKRGDQPGLDLREALKTWQFWCLAASGFAFMSPIGALLANIVPLLTDRGLSRTQAVEITSFLGLGAISGRLAVGVLLDRVYPPALAALTLCASVAGCLIICYWPGAAMVGTFLFGLSVGAEGNFMSFFTSRYFGIRAFSEILGWFYTPMSCGMVSGPLLAGILYGRFADYHILLLVCAALLLLAAILQGSLGPAPAFATLPKPKPDEAPQPRLHPDRTVTEKV
jgi:predicted MFS family arabinose efflux permease